MIARALCGESKESILTADARLPLASERVRSLARAEYRGKNADAIRGSGYVVESLEAALWAFARSRTFADAVRCAANLGDDADTTAAVCGQLAGAFYGEGGIPTHWLDALTMKDEIRSLAERLFDRARGVTAG
jgi:ADP-ribosyl-[dinitrogen reductase] hydrolase